MNIKEQVIQLTKEVIIDLVDCNYKKLKENNVLNEDTEQLVKTTVEYEGKITLPPDNMEIDLYEYNDNSGFGTETYLWFDDEESQLRLFCEAKTNAEKTEITHFYIDDIDA